MSSCTVIACIMLVLTADYAAGITGTNHLSCSPVDDNGYSTFPDYPVDRHQLSDTSVITLNQFLTIYSFTPDTYCRGNITGADFCFQYPLNENSSRLISTRIVFHIFSLIRVGALLVPMNNSEFVLWGLPIDRTSCIERGPDTLQCCERMTFFGGEKIPLDGGELLLGLFASNSEERYPLLQFTGSEYFVTAYEVNIGLLSERFITDNIYSAANSLEAIDAFPVLRFVVEPDPASPLGTAGNQGVISAILYVVIALLVLLSVSLFVGLVVAIVSCCRFKKKAKKHKEPNQPQEVTTRVPTSSMGVVNEEYANMRAGFLVRSGSHPPPYPNPAYTSTEYLDDYVKMNSTPSHRVH